MRRATIYMLLIAIPLFAKTGMKATNTFEVEDSLRPVQDSLDPVHNSLNPMPDSTEIDRIDMPGSLQDTLKPTATEESKPFDEDQDTVSSNYRNPTKAAIFSGVMPGLGQGYNRRYVKGSLFFAAEAAVVYYAWDNHRDAEALWDSRDEMEEGSAQWQSAGIEYEDKRDNRNLLLWVFTGLHLVNILDAYVDAHLSEFPEEMKKLPGTTAETKGESCSISPDYNPIIRPDKDGAFLGLIITF